MSITVQLGADRDEVYVAMTSIYGTAIYVTQLKDPATFIATDDVPLTCFVPYYDGQYTQAWNCGSYNLLLNTESYTSIDGHLTQLSASGASEAGTRTVTTAYSSTIETIPTTLTFESITSSSTSLPRSTVLGPPQQATMLSTSTSTGTDTSISLTTGRTSAVTDMTTTIRKSDTSFVPDPSTSDSVGPGMATEATEGGGTLTAGVVAGIAIGGFIFLLLVALLVFLAFRRGRKRARRQVHSASVPPSYHEHLAPSQMSMQQDPSFLQKPVGHVPIELADDAVVSPLSGKHSTVSGPSRSLSPIYGSQIYQPQPDRRDVYNQIYHGGRSELDPGGYPAHELHVTRY